MLYFIYILYNITYNMFGPVLTIYTHAGSTVKPQRR